MRRLINRSRQGDLGEASAVEWLTRRGAVVSSPAGHSPDYDLIADLGEGLLRVQVKTSTQACRTADGHVRFPVMIATTGGNQSWTRRVKRFDPSRFDALFVLVGCGRRWFLPSCHVEAGNVLTLGGRKYSEFEIEATEPIADLVYGAGASALDCSTRGGVSKRSTDGDCKSSGSAFEGSNPSSSTPRASRFEPVGFERAAGRSGQTIVSRKRQLTLPVAVAKAAELGPGDRLRVRADGCGCVVLDRIDGPGIAR